MVVFWASSFITLDSILAVQAIRAGLVGLVILEVAEALQLKVVQVVQVLLSSEAEVNSGVLEVEAAD